VPVLSPQDRYIDNIYQLQISPPAPASLVVAVANYHPQPEIAAFLQTIRTGKVGLPALPTSTFPSAHVLWAAIAGWYLFQADADARRNGRRTWRRWLGWIALPFLIASTFGTVLLAQHYFMDIPAALVIAALAIWLANSIAVS
jgi:membrane-associated phospholipid phosphatase